MNEVEKAIAILICMKHEYPATFRAHGLDEALQRLIDSQSHDLDELDDK